MICSSQISRKRIENPKEALTAGPRVTVKVLTLTLMQNAFTFIIFLKNVQEEGQNAKTCPRPRRPKRQEKRDFELQKLKLDSH